MSLVQFFVAALLLAAVPAAAQTPGTPYAGANRPAMAPRPPRAPRKLKVEPPNHVAETDVLVKADWQMADGDWYRLRGHSWVETSSFLLRADDIDYNQETGDAVAYGNVYLQHFEGGEELRADAAEYNVEEETGRFWNVRGSAPMHLEARPGVLTSPNPFYFQGTWAERLKEKYILHDGFITNCRMPKPWWIVRGPKFDVIPGDRALAYRSRFVLRGVPLFFAPVYYKSLERFPRHSGFLAPNIGNSSSRGKMAGIGYYWAISRSYDATYHAQYFSERGVAHTADLRGKPNARTDFGAILFGVNDRLNQGGVILSVHGRSDLGHGFYARTEDNYLSSYTFRRAFSESFTEAISSEVHSVGFAAKDWKSFGADLVFQRLENFQTDREDDAIVIRKLPQLEFSSRDRPVFRGLPVWISWESSAGLLRRKQLLFQTRQFLERMDFHPRVMTALRWKDFALVPSFAARESHYGESESGGRIVGRDVNRSARELSVALVLPSLERIYTAPRWLGDKVKHVIEPRASYRYVTGVDNFNELIRFDETELYSNTNEVEYSITNRLYAKRGNSVDEVFSWQLYQKRFFDPTFGGAVVPGQRNVVLSAIELTPFAFIDQPRNYSPVVSVMRMNPNGHLGVDWRWDYDPLRGKFTDSTLSADFRWGRYFVGAGHTSVRSNPILSPNSNQFRTQVGWGNSERRGWNASAVGIYDFRLRPETNKRVGLQYANATLTYNTDCCGFSLQWRRLNFGLRQENQFRMAFAVANLGSFGTLKKQERLF